MNATIPDNPVTMADLQEWYRLKQELGKIKSAEALLRSKIFGFYFTDPKEGTNKHELNDGTGAVLKGTHVINRSVDQGSLDAYRDQMGQEGSNLPKLNLGALIKWKPEVVIGEYRKLTAEEQLAFDQCLVIKPGSPQLEITIPKKAKPAG